MAIFRFTAADKKGQVHSGVLEAADKAALVKALAQQGLLCVSCREDGPRAQSSIQPSAAASFTSGWRHALESMARAAHARVVDLESISIPPLETLAQSRGVHRAYLSLIWAVVLLTSFTQVVFFLPPRPEDPLKRAHWYKRRSRSVLVMASLLTITVVLMVPRLTRAVPSPRNLSMRLRARHVQKGMTRGEADQYFQSLGAVISSRGELTQYLVEGQESYVVQYDKTGGVGSSQNILVAGPELFRQSSARVNS